MLMESGRRGALSATTRTGTNQIGLSGRAGPALGAIGLRLFHTIAQRGRDPVQLPSMRSVTL